MAKKGKYTNDEIAETVEKAYTQFIRWNGKRLKYEALADYKQEAWVAVLEYTDTAKSLKELYKEVLRHLDRMKYKEDKNNQKNVTVYFKDSYDDMETNKRVTLSKDEKIK